ncbi:50S ribosomal protein L3 [Candidatus Berkelbacteria bacterium]|nr:50S ribosomal protein L3 [Candidatus Berkelbacteria bacterium]
MHALIGKKVGMTRVADRFGQIVGVTVIHATPNTITQVRTVEKDGYRAVILGHGDPNRTNKPQREQLKKVNAKAGETTMEIRTDRINTTQTEEPETVGTEHTVSVFKPGDVVNVVATSKGRGTVGTVKRHHFKIGPRSHGSMNLRRPGSIGAQQPQRVILGKRMAGRLGGTRTTVKHLEILEVLPAEHLIVLKGAIPGIRGATILIKQSIRHPRAESKQLGGDE